MRIFTLAFFVTAMQQLSFAQPSMNSEFSEKAPETVFLRKVEAAVLAHDTDTFLSFVEPSYKRSQHDEFLGGRTDQFLYEFFCSEVAFADIVEVSLVNYARVDKSKTDYEVIFYLRSEKAESFCTFYLYRDPKTKTLSIYSAVG